MWAENSNSEAEKNKKELSEILRSKQELDIEIQMKKANIEEITKIITTRLTGGLIKSYNPIIPAST